MIINCTPHSISSHHKDGVLEIAPSGIVPRVGVSKEDAGDIRFNGLTVPAYRTTMGEVTGLPEPEPGSIFVVSALVANAAKRMDVMSPGELIRDEKGQPIGCKGLHFYS